MNPTRTKEHLMTSNMQKRKHIPSDGDSLFSIHKRDKSKTLWYKSSWESMEAVSVPTNKERVTYRSKIYPYHSLHRSVLTTVLPRIKVKDGEDVTISWCDNLMFSMIDTFQLMFNDTELQFGNGHLLYADQLYIRHSTPNLKFGTKLKNTPVSIEVPFSYANSETDAFPLHLCGQNDRLYHLFNFNLSIEKLLVMKDSNSRLVDVDLSKLEIENNYESIPVPDLEGLYTTHVGENSDFISEKENSLFVNSMYHIEDDNEITLGKRVNLKIDSRCNYPVEEIIWGAVNTTMTEENSTLYITTKNEDTPIKTSKIESKDDVILDTKESFKTEYVYNPNNYIEGLSRWRNSICDKDGKKFTPGVMMNGGKLTVTTNHDNLGCKFVIFMILKYTKQFVFTSYPKTQKERLTKGATIELVNE